MSDDKRQIRAGEYLGKRIIITDVYVIKFTLVAFFFYFRIVF